MKIKVIISFFVPIWVYFCQAPLSAEMYYLNDLINYGVQNSSTMIKSLNSLQDNKDSLTKIYWGILPSVTYSSSYNDFLHSYDAYSSSFSISKSLAWNEPIYFDLRYNQYERQIKDIDYAKEKKNLVINILFSYIDIIQMQKNISIVEENYLLEKRIHEQIVIQYENKNKTIYDVQQSEIDTLSTYIRLLEMKQSLVKAREELFFNLRLDDQGFPLEVYNFEITNPPDSESLPQYNLDLQNAELNLQMNKLSLNQQFTNLFPSLSLSFNWSATSINNRISNTFLQEDNYRESNTLSLNLSYSLFSSFQQGINYRMSKRLYQINKNDFDLAVKQVNQKIANIDADIKSIKENYKLYQRSLELSKVNLQVAEERFILGMISKNDLDTTRLKLLSSEYDLNNQFYTLIKKQEELNLIKSEKILGLW